MKNDIIKKGSIVKYIDGRVYIVYKVKEGSDVSKLLYEIEPIELSQKCIFDARHAQLDLVVGNELKGALPTL